MFAVLNFQHRGYKIINFKLFFISLLLFFVACIINIILIDKSFAENDSNNNLEPKAVLNTDNLLTFYYDDLSHEAEGEVFDIDSEVEDFFPWNDSEKYTTKAAVFDESWSDYTRDSYSRFFSGNIKLETVNNLCNINFIQTHDISSMFAECTKLSYVDFTGANFENVELVTELFASCENLREVILPQEANFKKIKNFRYVFEDCINLNTINNIDQVEFENLESLEGAFLNCNNLKSSNSRTSVFDISNWKLDKCSVWAWTFSGCKSISEISFPTDQKIPVKNFKAGFQWCSNLKTINLFSFNLNDITYDEFLFSNTSYMFYDCSNLKRIFVNEDTDLKPFMPQQTQDMFFGCKNLKGMNGTVCDYQSRYFLDSVKIDGKNNEKGLFSVNNVKIPKANELTYNGKAQSFVASDYCYVLQDNSGCNSGTYTVVAKLVDPDYMTWNDNTSTEKNIECCIQKATLDAKYIGEEISIQKKPRLLCEVSGFVNGETEETAKEYTKPTIIMDFEIQPGSYTLIPSGGSSLNYKFNYISGTLQVNPSSCVSLDNVATGDYFLFILIGLIELTFIAIAIQYKIKM